MIRPHALRSLFVSGSLSSRSLLSGLALFGGVALSGGLACSSTPADSAGDGDGDAGSFFYCEPADTCPPSVEGVDLTTPVLFRTDIYEPFLKGACSGTSGCHGDGSTSAANLDFGSDEEPLTDDQITALILQLKGAQAKMAPTEFNVVEGNWQASFLMTKLDGCQNDYGLDCDEESEFQKLATCDGSCGDGMPASEGDITPVPFARTEAERAQVHKVRAWIAQGAHNN